VASQEGHDQNHDMGEADGNILDGSSLNVDTEMD
jgi:hypothetical protein